MLMGTTTLVSAPATVPHTFPLPLGIRRHLMATFAIVSFYYSPGMEYGQLISNRQLGLEIGVDWPYGQMAYFLDTNLPLDFARNLIVLIFSIVPHVLTSIFDWCLVEWLWWSDKLCYIGVKETQWTIDNDLQINPVHVRMILKCLARAYS